jgi:hypothetical protein
VRNGIRHAEAVVKIRCTAGHVVTCAPAGVQVTHSHGIVVGHEVWCDQCAAYDSSVAEPERIAMLLEMGVKLSPHPGEIVVPVISNHRRLVSAKYLLEDEVIPQLRAERPSQDVLGHP